MNPKKQLTVTRGKYGFSSRTGTGIPEGMCVPEPVRMLGELQHFRFLKPALHGALVPLEQRTPIGIQHGFLQYYCRNLCGFVSNRSYRRHMGQDAPPMRCPEFIEQRRENNRRHCEARGIHIRK